MASSGTYASAGELLADLRAYRVTSEELLQAAFDRVSAVNPLLNPVVAVDEPGAFERARSADRARAAGDACGLLHGLPMTVKDCIEVAGLPTVNGAAELRDYRPGCHAAALQRLVDAGANVFGKTNVPQYSLDLQTFNPVFGVTRNPWNLERSPGGSSGGAAVAVATGITSIEIGSDLAGSLRLPAHATGICALKPSYGVVPVAGALSGLPGRLRVPDLMVVGPMARTVADLGLLLDILAGAERRNARAWSVNLPPPDHPAERMRIAAWLDDDNCPVDAGVGDILRQACSILSDAGLALNEGARPRFDARACFGDFLRLMYAELSAGFPPALYRAFEMAARRGDAGDEWTASSLMPAAVTQSHRQWLGVSERREGYRRAWDEFFTSFDILITPVAPATALVHDHRAVEARTVQLGGRQFPYMQQSFWCALATIGDLPAAVIPAGIAADGLPVGLQMIGPYLGERAVLEFAAYAEKLLGGFRPPPLPADEAAGR